MGEDLRWAKAVDDLGLGGLASSFFYLLSNDDSMSISSVAYESIILIRHLEID
jgi:hypothetical protein